MYKGKFASELSMCETKEYYDELRMKCPRTDEQRADFNILKERLIVFAYKILESKTNGDMTKTMFPNAKIVVEKEDTYNIFLDSTNPFSPVLIVFKSWWNAPYKAESEG